MPGWAKVKNATRHAGISERCFRGWLKRGLRHVRLPSGTILIKYEWIDKFLENFEVQDNEVSRIVDEIEKDFKK